MTQTVKGAMTILRLQWDATWHIIERAVARGKARKEPSLLPRIGIDEKAFAKGRKFVSILHDKFHIKTLAKDSVDKIRRGEQSICNLTLAIGRAWFLQRALTRFLVPGDGGKGKELLQRLVSASHSYQDGADEKTSSEFEGANR
jgi:hypothetical protein